MILEIDMGNTWSKWRLRNGNETVSRGKTLSVNFPQQNVLGIKNISRVRLASVCAPTLVDAVVSALSAQWSVVIECAQSSALQAGLRNSYAEPSHMGVDRWLAMLAAHQTAKRECLVVSCGTAITVDFIGSNGVHEGGYILPGLLMMRSALLSGTGRIHFEPNAFNWSRSPGTSTVEAVEHGAVNAIAAVLEKACMDCVERWGDCDLFITGGDAGALLQQLVLPKNRVRCHHVEELVLDGLQFALP